MVGCATTPGSHADRSAGAGRTLPQPDLSLLLVSANRRWSEAVRAVAAEISGSAVFICDARDALLRLAATARHYTHLLLQPSCADGLLNELVHLTAGGGEPSTTIVLLGRTANLPPRVGGIRSASRRSIRQALVPAATPAAQEARMHLTELHEALAGAMIDARYQPIVRIADRRPVAVEVLARLNHPTRGTLQPDVFVPQIEQSGLAAQLTDLITDRALTDVTSPPLAAEVLQVTLNFPLDVLLAPAALQRLETRRAAAGIPPERIIIEMTESRPVEDLAGLRGVLEKLRADGYRISIDDVGPAVPRIADLLELPFTSLKFDKDLVQRLESSPAALDFMRQVIEVAEARGLGIVAEGVEDVATWQRVAGLGVQLAQGFLVARPLPATAVPIWLEAWRRQPAFG